MQKILVLKMKVKCHSSGFIGFLDPPKESAKLAIEKLNNSGIRVIVLTGDNSAVTKCICKKVNINTNKIVTGSQIDKLADSRCSSFA